MLVVLFWELKTFLWLMFHCLSATAAGRMELRLQEELISGDRWEREREL